VEDTCEAVPNLAIDVGSTSRSPNAAGIEPYLKTPIDTYLAPPGLVIPSKLTRMLNQSMPVSPGTLTPVSAVDQQSLLEQLNALKEHIIQVEALARSGGVSNRDSHGSEPPPEYNVETSPTSPKVQSAVTPTTSSGSSDTTRPW